MEISIKNGDYVADGLGGVQRRSGTEALLQRILYRLSARRGQFPLMPEMGSRLYLLSRESAATRLSAARQYVAEALRDEPVTVTDVALFPAADGRTDVTVTLRCRDETLRVTLTA